MRGRAALWAKWFGRLHRPMLWHTQTSCVHSGVRKASDPSAPAATTNSATPSVQMHPLAALENAA